jgi:hypothetical protein
VIAGVLATDYTVEMTLMPDDDLLEYFCTDNETDIQHYQ